MSTLPDQYRQMAAQARSDAEAAELPNVQQRHLRSAERLDSEALSGSTTLRRKLKTSQKRKPGMTPRRKRRPVLLRVHT